MRRGLRADRGRRTGFTTGACAAAAARAAVMLLSGADLPTLVSTLLPNGEWVEFPVAVGGWRGSGVAWAVVVKDAGDDPDCTHGAHLTAAVRRLEGAPGQVVVQGGEGVGRVTRPGVGLPVGVFAINPVPMANIAANVRLAGETILAGEGIEVTVSVPGGERMAARTLNPRLGILGGISILGTTGIVIPYSTAAFRATVEGAIAAAAAGGLDQVVLATGRRTERFAMALEEQRGSGLPEAAFIQMGDFFGAALKAVALAPPGSFRRVVVAAMVGKLSKIAQDVDNTHAHRVPMDGSRVAGRMLAVGADPALVRAVTAGGTARYGAELLAECGLGGAYYQLLTVEVGRVVAARLPAGVGWEILGFGFDGELLAASEGGLPE